MRKSRTKFMRHTGIFSIRFIHVVLLSWFFFAISSHAQTLEQIAALKAAAGSSGESTTSSSQLQRVLPNITSPQNALPPVSPRSDIGADDLAMRQAPVQQIQKPKIEQPNQFQRFVQAATGKLLPLFGLNLFENPQAYVVDTAAPAPDEYLLGPGDEVRVQIWGAVDFVGKHMLDRNGQINLPKVGNISLAGVRVKDLESTLKKHVAATYSNFTLNASLGRLRGITVYVVGHAKMPGTYNLSSPSTLINAVFASGGPSVNGSMRKIELKRANQVVTTLDLYDFIANGDKSKDAALQPGDVIGIAPAGPRIALTGATDHGAIYEIKAGTTVKDILTLGGGLPSLSRPQIAQLERLNAVNENNPRLVQQIKLDNLGQATSLMDGDVLTLLQLNEAFQNDVTLRGNVAMPLRYAHKPGMRIADLIPEPNALVQPDYYKKKNILVQFNKVDTTTDDRVLNEVKNLLEEINWEYAVVERLNLKEIRTDLLPFNLARALRDKNPKDNLELQPGDMVTIFGIKDVPVPIEKRNRYINVAGEVKVPGIYQVGPDETLPQVIERAGGLTKQAYAFGSIFSRESSRKQQQVNLTQALRLAEADLANQSSTMAQNTTASEGTLLQVQLTTQKNLLERMKRLKASGRVALEMDPIKPVFPSLSLEDGDVLMVPNRPDFVAVFGAVQTETSFIWRKNLTVADYLDKSGVNRYADLESAMIIRADGTVLVNDAARSFIGWGNRGFMSNTLNPGDSVFVPEQIDRRNSYTAFIQGAKDWTQLFYQFGLGAAAVKTLRSSTP